jgi:leader peptidase (prepilin peptidase) / N-methyltransferase
MWSLPLNVIPYIIVLVLLAIAVAINIRTGLIPDKLTWPGALVGIIVSALYPHAVASASWVQGAAFSLRGAGVGYLSAFAVVEIGKLMFGRKRIRFDAPTSFTWTKRGDDADFVVGTEESLWSEYFAREKDQLLLHCDEVRIDDREYGEVTLTFRYDRVTADGHVLMLDDVTHISGVTGWLVIPREAMGFGVVKLMMLVGAFLGWRGALFTFFGALLLCAGVGIAVIVSSSRVALGRQIMFAPYILVAAGIWILWHVRMLLFH